MPTSLLLVTIAALAADELECYGGPQGRGRAVCSLGAPGTRYLWAFSPAVEAAPSAASILTGLLPSRHGLRSGPSHFLPSARETLAEALGARGYRCAAFVGGPELSPLRNLDQGFHVFRHHRPGTEQAWDGAAIIAWMAAAPRPFFVWAHLTAAQENAMEPGPDRLARLDATLEPLLRAAIEDERTAVALTSTRGRGDPVGTTPGRSLHPLAPERVRVPLFWHRPGDASAHRIDEAVSSLDLGPTLLASAGAGFAEAVDGLPLPTAGEPPGPPRLILSEHPAAVGAVGGSLYTIHSRRPGEPGRAARLRGGGESRAPRASGLAPAEREAFGRMARQLIEMGLLEPPPPSAPDGSGGEAAGAGTTMALPDLGAATDPRRSPRW